MKKIKEKIKSITLKQWHIAVIIIGIIFVSLGAFHTNTWFDENYSLGLANHSISEIWEIGGNDVHPILYYWFLRIVSLLTGGSIIAYRVFSIIPIAIIMILGYTHIRKDFGERTGFIFTFLSAFLPQMTLYATEIRMYSWAMLAVTLVAIYAHRLLKEDNTKNWIIFGISSLASIYLHYYGLMAAGLINVALLIYLIIKKRKKGIIFIISFGLVQALAYLPWLVSLFTQMGNVSSGFWIGFSYPKTPMELLSCQLTGYIGTNEDYRNLLVPTVLSLELYGYLIYKAYRYSKEKQNLKPFFWSVGMYFAVIIAAIIMTILMGTSILYYRYLFVITGFYIFAISFILGKEKNNVILVTILSVITLLGIYNNIEMIKENYSSTNVEFSKFIQESIKEEDTILYTNSAVGTVPTSKFKGNKIYFYNKEFWGVEEAYKAFGPNFETCTSEEEFIPKCSDRIWLIENAYSDSVDEIFEDTDYKEIYEKEFYVEYHDYKYRITLFEK